MRAIRAISILAVGLLVGSAAGVAAESVVVVGSIASGDECEVTPEGAESCTGGRFDFDDSRLTGDYEQSITIADAGRGRGFEQGLIATEDFRVTNDEVAWSGQSLYASLFPTETPEGYSFTDFAGQVESGNHLVLFGEGAYEGLTAYVTDSPRCCCGIILQ